MSYIIYYIIVIENYENIVKYSFRIYTSIQSIVNFTNHIRN